METKQNLKQMLKQMSYKISLIKASPQKKKASKEQFQPKFHFS